MRAAKPIQAFGCFICANARRALDAEDLKQYVFGGSWCFRVAEWPDHHSRIRDNGERWHRSKRCCPAHSGFDWRCYLRNWLVGSKAAPVVIASRGRGGGEHCSVAV